MNQTDEQKTEKVFSKRMWLHKDPQAPGNFNDIFRSRTEPILKDGENQGVLSEEAHYDGDMFTHINIASKGLFPKQLWDWIGFGEKVDLEVIVKARKKKLEAPITEMISKVVEEEKEHGEAYLKTHDRLLFVLKGSSVIHERQFVVYTSFTDGSGKKNVEYINSYGEIIRHPETEKPNDYYIVLGYIGDVVTPLTIGRWWGNILNPTSCLKEVLIKAYLHGLRFEDAPESDEIVFNVESCPGNNIGLSCVSDFYGFGENMIFHPMRDYQENSKLGTRGLDKQIINVIVTYRWFFNKPNLHARLQMVSGNEIDQEKCNSLCDLINAKVNEKYKKSQKKEDKNPHFDPKNLRPRSLIIPYAEESCRTL